MDYAVAVIDIGMTNKKIAVYDDELKQLATVYKVFEPLKITDPLTGQILEAHDLDSMKKWFFENLAKFAASYPLKAVVVTTHGATTVCIDKDGLVAVPCILYTHEPGSEFHDEFYRLAGDRISLQKTTYTPPFSAMINPSKGILFAKKHFAADFARTDCILNYPQYWGFVLTGKKSCEPTYNGSHTYLWNHETHTYSPVAAALGIAHLLPKNFQTTCELLGTLRPEVARKLGMSESVAVSLGVHDSNASLFPYLAKDDQSDFILNSTGTWCVCMHPQQSYGFERDDLGKIVYFNQSVLSNPVKTSIFLGGMELDSWVTLYQQIAKTDRWPQSTDETVNILFKNADTFLMPEIVRGSGQFTTSRAGIVEKDEFFSFESIQSGQKIPSALHDEKLFFALLVISLVIQTEVALKRAGLKDGTRVFTEGGFRKNRLYNALLATVLPKNKAFLTNVDEATAFGAAMTAVIALTEKSYKDLSHSIHIEYLPVERGSYEGYPYYKEKWLHYANKDRG